MKTMHYLVFLDYRALVHCHFNPRGQADNKELYITDFRQIWESGQITRAELCRKQPISHPRTWCFPSKIFWQKKQNSSRCTGTLRFWTLQQTFPWRRNSVSTAMGLSFDQRIPTDFGVSPCDQLTSQGRPTTTKAVEPWKENLNQYKKYKNNRR